MQEKQKNLDDYRDELYTYLNPAIDRLMIIGAFGATLSVVNTLLTRPHDTIPLLFNSLTTGLLLLLFLVRHKVSAEAKISIITTFLAIFGTVLLLFTAYELAGVLLIFLNVVLIVFLQKGFYQLAFLSVTTLVIFISFILRADGDMQQLSTYSYSLTIYTMLVIILPVAFRTIYRFLYRKLELLQQKLKEEEQSIALLQEKNQEIEHLAYHDRLTGLYNRYRFSALLNTDITNKLDGTLIFIDIKNFRKVNSLYGVTHGDKILSDIASVISNRVNSYGYVGYLGANSFVIRARSILSRHDYVTQVTALAHEINHVLDLAMLLKLYSVCLLPQRPDLLAEDYYKLAEDYVSVMKRQGIQHKYVDDAENNKHLEEEARKAFILAAVDSQRYEVHFQEKYDIQLNRVVGVEALARLPHDGKYISPGIFIPIVEADEHIINFGYLIIELVFRQFKRITEVYGEINVAINLSPKQLTDKDLCTNLQALIRQYDIAPQRLELEITENELISNFQEFEGTIRMIKSLGIKLAIDDFGTGYSSLGYLSILPADVIKIDKSFIDTIDSDKTQRAIVQAILDIAQTSDLEIVAEGVETQQQVDILRTMGVSVIQGYFFSKPTQLPAS